MANPAKPRIRVHMGGDNYIGAMCGRGSARFPQYDLTEPEATFFTAVRHWERCRFCERLRYPRGGAPE